MKTIPLACLCLLSAAATAQTKSILFTGRFPFVSLDSVNDRPGGSATRLEEFDVSMVTPGPGAVAKTLLPASAMQCYFGDANNDGNYLKFYNLKTYFENLQIGGLFVKAADKGNVTADKVWFTVRDNVAVQQFEVFTANGTAVTTLVPGDWIRLLPNGNAEFFMTANQLDVAAGPPPAGQTSIKGAHALLQAGNGDLYYVPVEGGHWVNGNQGGPKYVNDGGVVFIPASAITYDASGNVAALLPNSAQLLIDESLGGITPFTMRLFVTQSGAIDRTGLPVVVAGVYGKTNGIDFDPNGGTFPASFADLLGNVPNVPNLVFSSNAGSYGGTIFSTANNGSVATINGVLCGSTTPGVPATGTWLGVQFDLANFQPTMISLVLIDPPLLEPLLLDTPNFGALPTAALQPVWEVDTRAAPSAVVFLLATIGPLLPGGFPASLPLSALPPLFAAGSHPDVFVGLSPVALGLTICNPSGYGTWAFANPHAGPFVGSTLLLQAASFDGTAFLVSNPAIVQLK